MVVVDLSLFAPRVGDAGGSRWVTDGVRPRGVQVPSSLAVVVGVLLFWSFKGDWTGVCALMGDVVGVVARTVVVGEAGDSGRRKGEERGDPKERGEGL